ncbi:MAG: hypothetical protein Q4B54_11100 [Coriobacteriales bacterium]|nr:hypothetical protein [Coriobacteriales bacterium]
MKTSTRFVKAALLNTCVALVLCTLCEWLALYVFKTVPAEAVAANGGWIWPMFGINFVFSWVIATILGMIPAIEQMGLNFAMKRSNPSEGAKFGLLVNIPINTVYSLILGFAVGWLDACILNGAPFIASVFGFFQNIIPVWIACFIVTFLLNQPITNLARKICNDPEPQMH